MEQARELSESSLSFGDDLSGQVARLADLIPDPAYRHTSEPHAIRRRVDDLQRMQAKEPDSRKQLELLAGIFIRLDQAPNYAEFVEHLRGFGPELRPVLEEIIESIGDRDTRRATIRQTAVDLLQTGS